MTFEGLICPNCSGQLNEDELRNGNFICPHCAKNLKDKKYVAFIEYVIMIGLVPDLDFFAHRGRPFLSVSKHLYSPSRLISHLSPTDFFNP